MRRVTVASPDYLGELGTPEHPKDLLRHNCVRVLRPGARSWIYDVRPMTGRAVPMTSGLGAEVRLENPLTLAL